MFPRRRRLSQALAQHMTATIPAEQQGFGLLGLIVGLALSAAVVGVAVTAYNITQHQSDVAVGNQSVRTINQAVLASYASAPDFTGLSTTSMVQSNLAPKNLLKNGVLTSNWGCPHPGDTGEHRGHVGPR